MSQLVRLERKHTVWTAHCAVEGKIHEYNNKYNWLADERTRWWFACWCSGVARWIIQEGTAATAAVAMPVDVSFETNIKRSLSSSMTMKTMTGMESVLFSGGCVKRSRRQQQRRALQWDCVFGICGFIFHNLYYERCVAWKGQKEDNCKADHCKSATGN